MALLMTALCGIYCFALWITAQGFALLAVFALLAGSICGTLWTTVTPMLVEVVRLSRMTRVFGVICLGMVLPTTFAEPVVMQIVDSRKTTARIFLLTQIFVDCMFMAGSISLWLRAWKIAELEIEA
ncbi:putative Major facilitator superfamily (MFS) profile domain-containing protein [Seiridium unicorne]|uniref:Major facilitator superfamily (MFS) profile domain-containing protein n=1 Tax=Seiridium unicorne TaxID=138068 RepID=A0ABR2UKT5_9PEZI